MMDVKSWLCRSGDDPLAGVLNARAAHLDYSSADQTTGLRRRCSAGSRDAHAVCFRPVVGGLL